MRLWRDKRKPLSPIPAWREIQNDPVARESYTRIRGKGGLVRASWDEVTEIIAAANAYTIKQNGPDRVFGFSPIPAMSMISDAAGTRYLSLIGGTCMSYNDWYCDLPHASTHTWVEQTDVAESADWYISSYLLICCSNVPQTRTHDAHFYTEVRYKGTKSAVICPDYSEAAKFGDIWLNPKQGTDSALGMAFGHVILREYHLNREVPYFADYCRRYTDMPLLVQLEKKGDRYVAGRQLRASDLADNLGEDHNPEWKTIGYDTVSKQLVAPNGSIGFRWGDQGQWNLEQQAKGKDIELQLSFIDKADHDEDRKSVV